MRNKICPFYVTMFNQNHTANTMKINNLYNTADGQFNPMANGYMAPGAGGLLGSSTM